MKLWGFFGFDPCVTYPMIANPRATDIIVKDSLLKTRVQKGKFHFHISWLDSLLVKERSNHCYLVFCDCIIATTSKRLNAC